METPNMSYIDALSGGDESFKATLIAIVKKELPAEVAKYKTNIQNNFFKEAAENVHKLKHKISILGLETSYQIAIDYEEHLKINSITLKEEFEAILETMICYVNQL